MRLVFAAFAVSSLCVASVRAEDRFTYEFSATVLSLDKRISEDVEKYGVVWGRPITGILSFEPANVSPSGLHPLFPGWPLGEFTLDTTTDSILEISYGKKVAGGTGPRIAEAAHGKGINVMQQVSDGPTELVELYFRGNQGSALAFDIPEFVNVAELAIFTQDGVIEARIDSIIAVPEPSSGYGFLLALASLLRLRRRADTQ